MVTNLIDHFVRLLLLLSASLKKIDLILLQGINPKDVIQHQHWECEAKMMLF